MLGGSLELLSKASNKKIPIKEPGRNEEKNIQQPNLLLFKAFIAVFL